ncbi:hypothetical protein [Acinetobacter sp. YH12045]|uniref:hypothetical protein n=1 Tax=Acinetobacter sp. YH12045 TaxID=2601051 RepID=UPI0015D2F734|nr:hypothetical protein [Acinetobacter sp. YH12045]
MQYPEIDKELIGKKIVSIRSQEKRVFIATSISEHEVEGHTNSGGSTWIYLGISDVRLATQEEIQRGERFHGSCPHKYRSYFEIMKKQHIPHEYQEYATDFSKPCMMSVNAWVCDWCGQHIDRDTNEVLKPAIR